MKYNIGEEVVIADCDYAQMLGLVGAVGTVIENDNHEFEYKVRIPNYSYDYEYLNEVELE